VRRRLATTAIVLLAGGAGLALPSASQGAVLEAGFVQLRTVPATAGMRVALPGGSFSTGRHGSVAVPVRALARETRERVLEGSTGDGVPMQAEVSGVRLRDGGRASFDRFFGTTIAVGTYYRVRPRFVARGGHPIDPRTVHSYTLRSRHGVVVTAHGDQAVTLKRSRVVRLNRRLVSKPIEWSVESVMVEGTNVVHRAQQRFDPRDLHGTLEVNVLYFAARFVVRDALFGFPAGSAVSLRHPDGTVERHPLADDGTLVLPALPRGDYMVSVDAAGIAPERPLSLSRDQAVELKVVSHVDIALAGSLLAGLAIGLLVLRRPHLRALPPFLRRRPAGEALDRDEVDPA